VWRTALPGTARTGPRARRRAWEGVVTTLGWTWAISLIAAAGLLPVGILRMVAYQSGQIDHTPQLRLVAWLALGLGLAALVVFLVVSLWFAVQGERPV
jgi:hypothetical protein